MLRSSLRHWRHATLLALCLALGATGLSAFAAGVPKLPRIAGDWQQVTGDPDLGPLTNPRQQPVDFAIWQAADGAWQIWSCIRGTHEPGNTRLLYRWEGAKLTDANWKPMGIAMQAEEKFGEAPGGLQAPYVFKAGDHYEMFYGGWNDICSASSADGKTFHRRLNAKGKATLFRAPAPYGNTRDPVVLRIGDLWYCYFTAHTEAKGADFCCTSKDLLTWSEPRIVAAGGQTGSSRFSAECPFVVQPRPGQFYLFRTQRYGVNQQTCVYFSHDPLDFGIDHDEGHFLGAMPVAAPEIFKFDGQYYMAALLPSIKGIRVARMEFEDGLQCSKEFGVYARDPSAKMLGVDDYGWYMTDSSDGGSGKGVRCGIYAANPASELAEVKPPCGDSKGVYAVSKELKLFFAGDRFFGSGKPRFFVAAPLVKFE